VVVFLNITFEDSGSSGFVEAGGLENVCCVDPVVAPSSHYMFFEVCAELELIHGYTAVCGTVDARAGVALDHFDGSTR
jgi:hypothetical protein